MMKNMISGYIPILNPGKCGSSWLAHALTIHPYVSFQREYDFIYFLRFPLSKQWNLKTADNKDYLQLRNSDLKPDEKLFRLYELEKGAVNVSKFLIDKAPSNLYSGFIDFRHLYKHLKIICLYRDPRDIYISNEFFQQRQLQNKVKKDEVGELEYLKNNSAFSFAFENSRSLVALEKVLSDESFDYKRVSYEELKTNFSQKLWEIIHFLDLGLDGETVVHSHYIREPTKLSEHIKEAENFRPLFRKGVVGDWRNHITGEAAKDFIKDKYGDLLIEMGYEVTFDW